MRALFNSRTVEIDQVYGLMAPDQDIACIEIGVHHALLMKTPNTCPGGPPQFSANFFTAKQVGQGHYIRDAPGQETAGVEKPVVDTLRSKRMRCRQTQRLQGNQNIELQQGTRALESGKEIAIPAEARCLPAPQIAA